ncbi:MAG: DNA repair protein RecO C-terminal domain-containing protein [Bacteroidales bacterium]|nr:DNA repair protein RecO C-terminal domain-containing protein [Bacteroidales bacterium]
MAQTQSSRIIVLHLTKYGDSSLVVHAIDSVRGRCSYMLRGAGRSKHVTVGALHNLAVLDIVSVESPKSSMAYLKEYEPAMPLTSLRSDIVKSSIALFISELLYRTIVEQNSDDRLFAWLCDAIARLDTLGQEAPEEVLGQEAPEEATGQTSPEAASGQRAAPAVANFHLWFLAGLCTVLGFGPSQSGDFDGSEYLQSAKLTASPAFGSKAAATDPSRGDNLTLLRQLTAVPFAEAMAIPLSGARRRDFCDSMVRYISYHLGINLHLRSLDVLHDLYS